MLYLSFNYNHNPTILFNLPTQCFAIRGIPIIDDNMIIAALLVRLHLEHEEVELDPVARRGGEVPHAVLPAGVVVRVVRALDLPVGGDDLVLASTLLAVTLVLVKRESVMTRADVGAKSIVTLVLATAVIDGTFIHI